MFVIPILDVLGGRNMTERKRQLTGYCEVCKYPIYDDKGQIIDGRHKCDWCIEKGL